MDKLTKATRTMAAGCALLIFTAFNGRAQRPVTSLCNTGLTEKSALPEGCGTTNLVTPVNPESGGSSVDGNWALASPYPSISYNQQAPNPCSLSTFVPAWVDSPSPAWYNPSDGISQWITPEVDCCSTAPGWYVYRTDFVVPPPVAGFTKYRLAVTGQLLSDDQVEGIFLQPGTEGCRLMAIPGAVGGSAWTQFSFASTVSPDARDSLYFLLYNVNFSGENATGVRVEFTSADLTPE